MTIEPTTSQVVYPQNRTWYVKMAHAASLRRNAGDGSLEK